MGGRNRTTPTAPLHVCRCNTSIHRRCRRCHRRLISPPSDVTDETRIARNRHCTISETQVVHIETGRSFARKLGNISSARRDRSVGCYERCRRSVSLTCSPTWTWKYRRRSRFLAAQLGTKRKKYGIIVNHSALYLGSWGSQIGRHDS